MMKKALPLTFVLIGAALLIAAVVFWTDSNVSNETQSFGQSLRDWITLLAGLGASIKGWMDLMKKEPPVSPTQSNTDGGVIVSGKIESVGKDVIGRDQIVTTNIISEDSAYNVEGLPNPYLGLRAFTYEDRNLYAGREKVTEEALHLLLSTDENRNLLFVTGSSGSGKSSFVQASLLPAIVSYYKRNGIDVRFGVIRPSRTPVLKLKEVIRQIGSRGIRVIVIDQFEELFTQSLPSDRDEIFEYMKNVSNSSSIKNKLLVIATLRSDYFGEMFDIPWLWNIAKVGVELREMKIQEIKDAIQRPLQTTYPNSQKRFEAKLVDKLAIDTAESATYIPLLQVTLEDLWNKGHLKLGAYNFLTDAIKERADLVLNYHDFDSAIPKHIRTDSEKEEILTTLLDLVNPSPDNDVRHDVRVTRKLEEFSSKQIALLYELSKARLVSIEIENGNEVANLIHEAIIRSWDVLRNGINNKRIQLQKRSRFEEQLRLWMSRNYNDDYLLSKGQVADAMELRHLKDISTKTEVAEKFLRFSLEKIENNQKRELEIVNMSLQVKKLDILATVSRELSGATTSEDVFKLVFTRITQLIQITHLWVTFQEKQNSRFYFSFFIEDSQREPRRENNNAADLSVEVIRKGTPLLTQSYASECQTNGVLPVVDNLHAWMCVPLTWNAKVIGSLSVGNSSANSKYSEQEFELLQEIAPQIAGAIIKVRSTGEQLKLTGEIVRDISGSLNLDDLLTKSVNYIHDRYGYYFVSIYLIDSVGSNLVFRKGAGEIANTIKRIGRKVDIGSKTILGFVSSKGEMLVVNDTVSELSYESNSMFQKTRSEVAIPLKIGERILGVLDVHSSDSYSFNDDNLSSLTILADQIAIATLNTELFTITQEHLSQHRLLHHITASAASGTSLVETLKSTVNGLEVTLGGDRVAVLLLDEAHKYLKVAASTGYSEDLQQFKVDIGSGVTGWVAANRRPLRVKNVAEDQRYIQISPNTRSELAVPLVYRNNLIGVLNVESEKLDAYTENDEEMLGTLAGSLAAIITNNLALEQIRAEVDSLKSEKKI